MKIGQRAKINANVKDWAPTYVGKIIKISEVNKKMKYVLSTGRSLWWFNEIDVIK